MHTKEYDKSRPVLLTTMRGAFFGYLQGDWTPERAVLADCRMVVRWMEVRGVLSLASDGPGPKCRVTPAAPCTEIIGSEAMPITSVTDCTSRAIKAFEAAPWG